MSDLPADAKILGLTANIVSAHVSHNSVTINDLPTLIMSVHRKLASVDSTRHR